MAEQASPHMAALAREHSHRRRTGIVGSQELGECVLVVGNIKGVFPDQRIHSSLICL